MAKMKGKVQTSGSVQIDRIIPGTQQQKQELLAYRKLRELIQKILMQARGTISADTIRQALDQARMQLNNLEEHSATTVDRVAASVEKDMVYAAQRIGMRWEAFSEKTADLFGIWRHQSREFLGDATAALNEWIRQTSARIATRGYRAGEMAAAGTLECTVCGERIVLDADAHLPSCENCRGTEFRRV